LGVRYSVQATWQASLLTSSLLVSATRISVLAIPGGFQDARLEPLPLNGADVSGPANPQNLLVVVDDGSHRRFLAREVIRAVRPTVRHLE